MSNLNEISKNLGLKHNVCIRVIDKKSKKIIQQHIGHNAATSTLLEGIASFIAGSGVFDQTKITLSNFIPQYMSLGTMGLYGQQSDTQGLPLNISNYSIPQDEEFRFNSYLNDLPGFGADGYNSAYNNDRPYFGLGPIYKNTNIDSTGLYKIVGSDGPNPSQPTTVIRSGGELISNTVLRVPITYREIIPEVNSEAPKCMDIVLGALVSSEYLSSFLFTDSDTSHDTTPHLFITEAGLWSKNFSNGAEPGNGLLAGYRITPINEAMFIYNSDNYKALREMIIRVEANQVVQLFWKIQVGSIEDVDVTRYVEYKDGPYWIPLIH